MSGREVTARTTLARDQAACTTADLDAVRYEVERADVLADVAKQAFDLTNWREVDDARVDHVSHLVAAASEAASAALLAMDDLRRVMASRRAVPSGRDLERRMRPSMSKERNGRGEPVEVVRKRDLETYFDELRRAVCPVDALADATVDAVIGAYGESHKSLVDERVHQLASATAEAALEAVEELDHVRLAIEREVPSVKIRNAEEIWVVGVDVAATRT